MAFQSWILDVHQLHEILESSLCADRSRLHAIVAMIYMLPHKLLCGSFKIASKQLRKLEPQIPDKVQSRAACSLHDEDSELQMRLCDARIQHLDQKTNIL